ncbi:MULTISPECIES: PAS domain-containing protein [Thalassospira]|jgi:PAS domain S-box-containing protein|uniref:PAS domain S-box protein n=2 Tax=Thalassospira TaxID=168934 RepID=A0A358HNY2_9PROT|nr:MULTISPECIES: PAS domain-containing protein [Thalassospira]PKR57157.1 chemotaxis protein [Thalassospira lohafexi]HBU96474.1 PAS domain S-box protein [Thalassospira lucentensis]HCW66837.1 PAS domain S-box protein [Thalassospira lucentensis]|tara:strand:+ start:2056 stop:2580 length:525 start_codon:yes stop_codon:yes gene_type:complete
MKHDQLFLTGVERYFDDTEIIVSKTDTKGRITYANDVFLRVAGYSEKQLLGQPHSIIRHPDMPRCVFSLLWETVAAGREIFAYVINRCANGDHYWVLANVTPTIGRDGKIIGYHSNRRVPRRDALKQVIPLYAALCEEEEKERNRKEGMARSTAKLGALLADAGIDYDQFVFTL